MRRYKIPVIMYVLLVVVLLGLGVGQTYAYFSAKAEAEGKLGLNTVTVQWYNTANGLAEISSGSTITVSGELKRGQYTAIQDASAKNITLTIRSGANIEVYCRVKLTATYTSNNQLKDCSQYIVLAHNGTKLTDVANTNWEYEDGYYYYKDTALKSIPPTTGNTATLANQFYLSPDSSLDIYGKDITITLTAQLVQASHNANEYEWQ